MPVVALVHAVSTGHALPPFSSSLGTHRRVGTWFRGDREVVCRAMQDWSTSVRGLSTNAVMICWAQADVGITPWPTPGKRSATELLRPGVTSFDPLRRGAGVERARQDQGRNLAPHREGVGGVRPAQTPAPHSRKIQLPVGVIRSTESGSPGIAVCAADRAWSGVVQSPFPGSTRPAPARHPAGRVVSGAGHSRQSRRQPGCRHRWARAKIIRGMSAALVGSALQSSTRGTTLDPSMVTL